MNDEQIQNLIDSIEHDLKNPSENQTFLTREEARIIFKALGLDDDLIEYGTATFKAVFYAVLQQAQKTKQLESRIEELEKISHHHHKPANIGPQ